MRAVYQALACCAWGRLHGLVDSLRPCFIGVLVLTRPNRGAWAQLLAEHVEGGWAMHRGLLDVPCVLHGGLAGCCNKQQLSMQLQAQMRTVHLWRCSGRVMSRP